MDICGVFTSKRGQLQLRASNDLGQSFGRSKCSEMARVVPAGQRRIIAGHRSAPPPANSQTRRHGPPPSRSGDVVALRPLAFYDAVGRRLAADGAAA